MEKREVRKAYLGIDAGSVSIKLAMLDENEDIVSSEYLPNAGIIETVKRGLAALGKDGYQVAGMGVTGSGREFLSILVGADVVETEIIAHAVAALKYYPDARTIMDVGGEDSKIMFVRNGILEDFVLNSVCGAGTGSILDAVAARFGIQTEEVGELAMKSKQRLYFPGKCGIFAQSSVVSRLNRGAEKADILMGIIRALINNFLMLAKGRQLSPPYIYQGATARNPAISLALAEQLQCDVIVPEHCAEMGAIGAALIAKKEVGEKTKFRGFDLADRCYTTRNVVAGGCENNCELTLIFSDGHYIGSIGNRCGKCVADFRDPDR